MLCLCLGRLLKTSALRQKKTSVEEQVQEEMNERLPEKKVKSKASRQLVLQQARLTRENLYNAKQTLK